MNKTKVITQLEKTAAEREDMAKVRRAHAAHVRELIRQAHAAGIGPTQIAEASGLSRQAVYDVLKRPTLDQPG
jgi:DNA invertase Pin-like site-specific DNA recombinase